MLLHSVRWLGPNELNTRGHLAVTLGKFQAFSNGGRNTDRPADQDIITFGDTLSWTLGRHSVRVGGDFVRNQAIDGFAVNRGNVRGLVTYSGTGRKRPRRASCRDRPRTQ